MQQPERAVTYSAGNLLVAAGKTSTTHPVWYYGLLFGALSGLFAIVQLAVSVTSAVENRAAFASLYYGLQNQALDPTVLFRWLGPVLAATYTSCLLGFALSMWLCWHAGRATAIATGRRTSGALAGMVASMVSSVIWIVASVVAVVLVHTDGSISGILTANPTHPGAGTGSEIAGLVLQEAIAALIALGFAAVAGRLGAASVPVAAAMRSPTYGQPPSPGAPGYVYYGPYGGPLAPPTVPSLTPPTARPFVVAPMYPPPADLYHPQQQGVPYGYPPASPYPGAAGYPPPPGYPAYPGYPPMPWYSPPYFAPPPALPITPAQEQPSTSPTSSQDAAPATPAADNPPPHA